MYVHYEVSGHIDRRRFERWHVRVDPESLLQAESTQQAATAVLLTR